MRQRVFIQDFSALCAMGRGKAALLDALRLGASPGMGSSHGWRRHGAAAFVGTVEGDFPAIDIKGHDTRNNRILRACLEDIAPALRTELTRDRGRHQHLRYRRGGGSAAEQSTWANPPVV
jgi:hypothetical protein